MFLREIPEETLTGVMDSLESKRGTAHRASNDNVSVDIGEDPEDRSIKVNETTVPLNAQGMEALAAWLDIPRPFLLRQGIDLQQHLLNTLLLRTANEGIFRLDQKQGLIEIYGPNQVIVDPRSIVQTMINVVDEKAPVIVFRSNPEEFRLDFTVPEGFDRGIGGNRRKGDLTRGGWRTVQDRKHNHAPYVAEYYYRLVCTNGMEVEVEGEQIDTRRQTAEETLVEIELQAQRIMSRHEERIKRFYDLQNERVPHPEQALFRLADETGISNRVSAELAKLVPTVADEDGTMSQFDLVNLVTNFANEPSIARREGSRMVLEKAGGTIVHEHAERCTTCASRIQH